MPEVNKALSDAALGVKSHLTWCREEWILDCTLYWNWNVSPSWYSWRDRRLHGCRTNHWIEYFLAKRLCLLIWANIRWCTALWDRFTAFVHSCLHSSSVAALFWSGSCWFKLLTLFYFEARSSAENIAGANSNNYRGGQESVRGGLVRFNQGWLWLVRII